MAAGRQGQRSARARLLTAADELFYAQGISSTGVDAVVARAGVATASLYRNFAGKDDLVAAYLQARDERWRDHWETCIAEQAEPVRRALALFTAMHRWHTGRGSHHGCAHVTAALQLPEGHPGLPVAREHKAHLMDRLAQLVKQTRVADPDEVTRDLLVIYEGMFVLLAMDLDPDPITRARRLAERRLSASPPVI